MSTRPNWFRQARCRGDNGAVLAEFALFTPVIVVMAIGILEFGLIFRDVQTTSSAASLGVRTVATLGEDRAADYEGLATVDAAIAEVPDARIQKVIVYNAANANGSMPAACDAVGDVSGGGQGVSGQCNVYFPNEINAFIAAGSASAAGFTGTNCAGTPPDRFWCPEAREDRLGAVGGPSWVGLYIEVAFEWQTGLFPFDPPSHTQEAVMRVEPGN